MNRNVPQTPSVDKALQVRLMACARMQLAGHRGVAPTLFRFKQYCVWPHNMDSQVREFVHQCLHCADSRDGETVPRPFGNAVHGTAPCEVVHFDCLYDGGSLRGSSDGLPDDHGCR